MIAQAKPKNGNTKLPPPAGCTHHVGLDQSYTGTGLVILDHTGALIDHHLIKTKPGATPMEAVDRLGSIFDQVKKAILSTTTQDSVVSLVMEDFAFGQANQMAALGGLGWHLRYRLARETPWHFATCPVGTLKKFATGLGNAKKDQMLLGVYKRWGFEAPDDNVADAYALAKLCWILYAQPPEGIHGVRKDDTGSAARTTIYR